MAPRYILVRFDEQNSLDCEEFIKLVREGRAWDVPSPDSIVGEATPELFHEFTRLYKVVPIGETYRT